MVLTFNVYETPWIFSPLDELRKFIHFLLKYLAFPLVCFLLILACRKNGRDVERYGKAFVIWYFVYFIYCLLQRYYGVDWIRGFSSVLLEQRIMSGNVYRLSGFMSHPLSFSYNLLLLFMLSVALFLRQRNSSSLHSNHWCFAGLKIEAWFCLSVLLGLMLILSGSRAPTLLGLFFVFGILIYQPSIQSIYKYLISSFLLLLFVLNQSLRSRLLELFKNGLNFFEADERFKFWEIHWRIFNDFRWAGTGLSSAEPARLYYFEREGYTGIYSGYNAHSIFLQNLADFGIWGMVSLVIFFGSYAYALRLCVPNFPRYFLSLFFVSVFVGGFFQNHLRDSEFNFALILCLAVLSSFGVEVEDSKVQESHKGEVEHDSGFLRKPASNRQSLQD